MELDELIARERIPDTIARYNHAGRAVILRKDLVSKPREAVRCRSPTGAGRLAAG